MFVIPAKAGIQLLDVSVKLDSGFRRNDEPKALAFQVWSQDQCKFKPCIALDVVGRCHARNPEPIPLRSWKPLMHPDQPERLLAIAQPHLTQTETRWCL